MALDLKRRARRVASTLKHWDWTQRIVAVIALIVWNFTTGLFDDVSTGKQTRRDTQHNANVAAQLDAAVGNRNGAEAHEDKRLEADGRYQESERSD